ncbi:MAG: metallophosphoesterase [Clostridia bacterium]|nr:metallophosphoesterase [Clostridia bacterium]
MDRMPNYRLATEKPDHIMVSISGDAKTSMTVSWRADRKTESGYLEYYEKNGCKFRVNAVTKPFVSDVDTSSLFWACAKNLKPGTRYYYTCGNDLNRSEEYWFDTEEENLTKFRFLAISDHQKDNDHYNPDYSYLNKFLKRILSENEDLKFILTAGDNTNCGQHEIQWNAMFEGLEGIIEHLPYMMTCGNHDNRGFEFYFPEEVNRYYAEPAEFFNAILEHSYPLNGPENWRPENYSFDYGNAHFTVYGVNEPELVNEWSLSDLALTRKTWKFGSYHFPMYYSGSNLSNDDGFPMMRECFEKQDVIFSGHEHNFSRSYPIKNEELYEKPSQGTVHYELGNGHCNPPGTKTCDKIWHCSYYPQEEQVSAYTIVEIDGNKAKFTSGLDDGRIIDECVIDKDNDEIIPRRLPPVFGPGRTRMIFKGMDCGLCAAEVPPIKIDGKWFIAFGTLCTFIGGSTVREKGKMTTSVYGKSAVFYENSDAAEVNGESIRLENKVVRANAGQLYVPLDSVCNIFGFKWAYAAHNNFISIETSNESEPVPEQP